ncbi:TIGR02611 family protein [Embleya sp. NPDC020630]|uniref:TIGR02611 family protein n=1 Tax=Embleya sp. NPDC020630 TaxID=3363979 RepID=UPI0037BDD7B7
MDTGVAENSAHAAGKPTADRDDPAAAAASEGATNAGTPTGAPEAKPFGSRAPAFIKRSKPLHMTWQIGVAIIGFAIIVGGIIMLPLPGPGWAVIFLGLAVLGTEFVWAQRTLLWTKDKVTRAATRALDPKTRRRNMIMLAIGLLLIAAAVALYLWKYGMALPF